MTVPMLQMHRRVADAWMDRNAGAIARAAGLAVSRSYGGNGDSDHVTCIAVVSDDHGFAAGVQVFGLDAEAFSLEANPPAIGLELRKRRDERHSWPTR